MQVFAFAGLFITLIALGTALPAGSNDPLADSADPSGLVVRTIPAPTESCGDIAWDGESLWVADWQAGELLRVNPDDGRVLARVKAPCYRPRGLTAGAGLLYIADDFEGLLWVFDPATKKTVNSFPLPSGSGMGLAWDGETIWVADNATASLQRISPADGALLARFPAPDEEPSGLAFDGTYLWVAARNRDRVYLIDPNRQQIVSSFDSPGPYPCGLAPAKDGQLWLADFETGELVLCAPREAQPYQTRDSRETIVRMTYRIDNRGPGRIVESELHFAVPAREQENQTLTGAIEYFGPGEPDLWEDQWGQSIATFRAGPISANESLEAGYEVQATLADLNYLIFPERVGTLDDIPSDIRKLYTVDGDRLQVGSKQIRETARAIVGDEQNLYWVARRIYDWVMDRLEYERIGGWDLPETCIERGSGSCSEYTFLFIALCRAAGLPARFEAGSALRGDDASIDTVHHRWAEVYLPGYGWIPCDPSHGDKPSAGDRADAFGRLSNGLFITTHGGGDSKALAWTYNARASFATEGRCDFAEDEWIVWRRAKTEGASVVPSRASKNR